MQKLYSPAVKDFNLFAALVASINQMLIGWLANAIMMVQSALTKSLTLQTLKFLPFKELLSVKNIMSFQV